MVLVAQFGASAVGGIRQEEKTQRAVAASSESKPWIAPPLPHNEMLARTYSASNFGSITPLANQMTALAASWRCACLSISRHSPASTSVPHMTQLVPHLRRGLSARTLTARAMACEPLNSVGTQGDHEPEIVNAPKGLHIWLARDMYYTLRKYLFLCGLGIGDPGRGQRESTAPHHKAAHAAARAGAPIITVEEPNPKQRITPPVRGPGRG